ncbi:hypothetical protein AVEN_9205-1 [Araneus ventricosus]|uniref:Uncharacterized protein n=1 Tax=Araneus ventricosus TaxID=182803 RepID=A0A4Y2JRE2_ARAVE|nr:hypothetical protein AVEN_9205-1 [Araneus ventricosus]
MSDNDKTIIYFSTPTSDKSVQSNSTETTPLNKQSLNQVSEQGVEEDLTTDLEERVECIETLNARERQALYNTLKDSPEDLREWEQLFSIPLEPSSVTPASKRPSLSPSPQQIFSINLEKENLNKSIHLLREMIHSRDPITIVPAPLRAKAEE